MATRRWPPSADQVIEGFIRWLNTDCHAVYEIVERPDMKERTHPAIDYVLRDPNTQHELAVEVSSIWRSKDAGTEDAYVAKWFETVRRSVASRVPGVFYLTLPIRVPDGADAQRFAEALVETIQQNHAAIVTQGQLGKMLPFTVNGIQIWIFQSPIRTTGSDIDYARSAPDMKEFPSRVRTCLDEKATKLKRYSDAGMETWIVIYNTMASAMSPFDADRIVKAECTPLHAHVTHIALVVGNPPDDSWVQVVR